MPTCGGMMGNEFTLSQWRKTARAAELIRG